MDGTGDEAARGDLMPYGVDTIRLRISFPPAPASQGYDDRMWRMRPLRGWTGGAEWDAREAAAAAQANASSSLRATLDRVIAAVPAEAPAVEARGGVQYAQKGPPEREETIRGVEPDEGPLSDAELFRIEVYGRLRKRLKEIDPENLALKKSYLTGRGGFVPTEGDLEGLGQALDEAHSRRPLPQGPVNTFADPGGPAPRLTVGPTDYSGFLPPVAGSNRGLVFVPENLKPPASPAMREAYRYQAQTAGSSTDPVTGRSPRTPALRYDNPNSNGESIVRWDGIQVLPDGAIELIDAKTAVRIFPTSTGPFIPRSFRDQLLRQSAALAQNPNYTGVIEVPTAEAAADARSIINDLDIGNISVRVRPSQP